MNRYIYRAKLLNWKETGLKAWTYGAYYKFLPYTPSPVGSRPEPEENYKHLIIRAGFSDWNLPRELTADEIDINTLVQCTGYKDCTGLDIFEGDIITYEWLTPIGKIWRDDGKMLVEWRGDGFSTLDNVAKYDVEHGTKRNVKVIGNIIDCPELK